MWSLVPYSKAKLVTLLVAAAAICPLLAGAEQATLSATGEVTPNAVVEQAPGALANAIMRRVLRPHGPASAVKPHREELSSAPAGSALETARATMSTALSTWRSSIAASRQAARAERNAKWAYLKAVREAYALAEQEARVWRKELKEDPAIPPETEEDGTTADTTEDPSEDDEEAIKDPTDEESKDDTAGEPDTPQEEIKKDKEFGLQPERSEEDAETAHDRDEMEATAQAERERDLHEEQDTSDDALLSLLAIRHDMEQDATSGMGSVAKYAQYEEMVENAGEHHKAKQIANKAAQIARRQEMHHEVQALLEETIADSSHGSLEVFSAHSAGYAFLPGWTNPLKAASDAVTAAKGMAQAGADAGRQFAKDKAESLRTHAEELRKKAEAMKDAALHKVTALTDKIADLRKQIADQAVALKDRAAATTAHLVTKARALAAQTAVDLKTAKDEALAYTKEKATALAAKAASNLEAIRKMGFKGIFDTTKAKINQAVQAGNAAMASVNDKTKAYAAGIEADFQKLKDAGIEFSTKHTTAVMEKAAEGLGKLKEAGNALGSKVQDQITGEAEVVVPTAAPVAR